ncbi:MAG TPA: hypothetical protein VIJ51_13545 [Solirubrobacteraceae bacterium]
MRLKYVSSAACAAAAVTSLAGACLAAAPASAAASKHITITAAPNPIVSGDPVVIFGQLTGRNDSDALVKLFHRVAGQPGFTLVSTTHTGTTGAYEFSRADGVVTTNRAWYVRSNGVASQIVRERVQALVTLSGPADGSTLLTGPAHPYAFSGTVNPIKVGARVELQRQEASGGNGWNTIQTARVRAGGAYSMVHTFRDPGDASIRTVIAADVKNASSASSPLDYEIEQAQNAALTISAATNPLPVGSTDTISGTLQGGAGQLVTLLASTANNGYVGVATATGDAGGNYSFAQAPINSTFYKVQGGGKSSAVLFVGVKDGLTGTVSATSVTAGQSVTFTGSVTPNKTGHVIYLQRQNASGSGFHTVIMTTVGANSSYSISRAFYDSGTKVMRVLIPGGPDNQGAATAPVTITVTP